MNFSFCLVLHGNLSAITILSSISSESGLAILSILHYWKTFGQNEDVKVDIQANKPKK
jgi:hypothetical protein